MKIQSSKFKIHNYKGVALVAVLAVLVVLTIMAGAFAAMMNIESKQSKVHMESQQLDMLVNAGLEHAKALLTVDEMNAISRGRVANIAANRPRQNQ